MGACRGNNTLASHHPCKQYERFSTRSNKFTTEGVLSTLNLRGRGNIILYRDASLTDAQCPGLQNWIMRAIDSVFPGQLPHNLANDLNLTIGSDDSGDEDEDPENSASSSQAASSSATPSTSRKRKHGETSPMPLRVSKRGRPSASVASPFMREQTRILEAEDEEDSSFTRPLRDGEQILVGDSEEEYFLA